MTGALASTTYYLNPLGREFHYPSAAAQVDTGELANITSINKEIAPLQLKIATRAFYATHKTCTSTSLWPNALKARSRTTITQKC